MLGLKQLLFFMVGGIILLHSFVPHEHVNVARQITIIHNHQCTTNLFGEIELSFGVDHGQGHFEHFVKIVQDSPNLQLVTTLGPIVFNEPVFSAGKFDSVVYLPLYTPPDPLRGPPVLSI